MHTDDSVLRKRFVLCCRKYFPSLVLQHKLLLSGKYKASFLPSQKQNALQFCEPISTLLVFQWRRFIQKWNIHNWNFDLLLPKKKKKKESFFVERKLQIACCYSPRALSVHLLVVRQSHMTFIIRMSLRALQDIILIARHWWDFIGHGGSRSHWSKVCNRWRSEWWVAPDPGLLKIVGVVWGKPGVVPLPMVELPILGTEPVLTKIGGGRLGVGSCHGQTTDIAEWQVESLLAAARHD